MTHQRSHHRTAFGRDIDSLMRGERRGEERMGGCERRGGEKKEGEEEERGEERM